MKNLSSQEIYVDFQHNFVADKAKKYAGGLSPGKYFSRRMQQKFARKMHVYTLVKTGSKSRSKYASAVPLAAGAYFAFRCHRIALS